MNVPKKKKKKTDFEQGHVDLLYLPELVAVRIYNGKTPVRCKITEEVNNLESLLLHGNADFREQILDREEKGK